MFRTAVIAFALLSTAAQASPSCMSKSEARQAFATSHIYWHGEDRCWDATPPHRHRAQRREAPPVRAAVPLPPSDMRRFAHAMLTEPEPVQPPPQDTAWLDRWTAITRVAAKPTVPIVVEREPKPMVEPRDVMAMLLTVFLTICLVEVVFGGMINDRRRKRYHGFGSR